MEHVSHWRATIFISLCWGYILTKIYDNPIIIVTWPLWLALGIAAIRLFIWGKDFVYKGSLKDCECLKKGDIILIGKQSVNEEWYLQLSNVLSHPIRDRFWTHVAIYQGNGKLWEALPHGVDEKDIWFYMHGGYIIRALRYRMEIEDEAWEAMFAFCRKQKLAQRKFQLGGGFFYLLATVTPIGFNFLFDNPLVDRMFKVENAYFCSELLVDAFKFVGYPITPYDGWRVKPVDFIGNPFFEDVRPLTPSELAAKALGLNDEPKS